jgi:serine/threonine protein kinase/cytochrome c-type biogenesis protein CcmH/NrfG
VRVSERVVADLVDAILDGTPVDWAVAASSVEEAARPLVKELSVLAAVAALHRDPPPIASTLSRASSLSANKGAEAAEHWGHLRLLERIGRGTFGEVYRAWDMRLDREVALKLLTAGRAAGDREASSIIHEGRLLARVRHPNVVTIYGAEQIGDQIGLWMEFVRGHTLEQILEQRTVLSAAEAVGIGLELCRAVSAVHSAGLLHRDIKAHNVMRAEDGRIVLMDFGTGRDSGEEASSDLAGTPLYLAPEILRGQQAAVRSDIYSLGILLYHVATGSYPVHAQTVRELRAAHERGERTGVQTARRDVRPKLARIIERAIDPQPERRYQSADALGADLAALKPRPTVVRLGYAVGVAAALIVAIGVAWEVRGRQLGSSRTPSALLAGSAGLNPVSSPNVSPAEQPVIVVLPLKNLSAEPDSDYFVDGLTDEIIRNLAVIEGLAVRSRTSSFAFKDKPHNVRDIGDQLGANLVVEGSVLRSGTKLRINAQLIQVAGDVPLWSDRFDRELKDIFAIQDEISRAIVNKLRLTLGRGQRRYDTNLEAYDLYLKARALVDRRGVDNAQKAAELFEQVVTKDPAFAPAHAGLANAYAFLSTPNVGIPFETAYPIMRPAAVTALQLDPLLAEAHAAMGWVYSYERDWANAEKAFQQALTLNPSLTQIYTSYSISTLQPLGKHDEALRLLQVALQNDPLSLDVQREIGQVQLLAGRYEEAIETLQRAYAVEPDFPFVSFYLARALMITGRLADASLLERAGAVCRAHAYTMTGQRAEAEKLAAAMDNPYAEAMVYAFMGDKERTFEALERVATSAPHRLGRLLMAPELAGLRGNPRVVALRRKFGLP